MPDEQPLGNIEFVVAENRTFQVAKIVGIDADCTKVGYIRLADILFLYQACFDVGSGKLQPVVELIVLS